MTAFEYLNTPLPDARDIVVSMHNQFLLRRFPENEATAVAAILERKSLDEANRRRRQERREANERQWS